MISVGRCYSKNEFYISRSGDVETKPCVSSPTDPLPCLESCEIHSMKMIACWLLILKNHHVICPPSQPYLAQFYG